MFCDFERKQIVPILLCMYINIYIYVHCYLFPFDYPYVNIVLIMAKDTLFFLKKKIISFFEGKKNRVFTYIHTHTHTYTHTHTHTHIYIYIHMNKDHVDLLLVGYYATLRA